MNVVYVNTPLTEREHRILEKLATAEGRSKGKQLRHLALLELERLGFLPARAKTSTPSGAAPSIADPETADEASSHANNPEGADHTA